MREARSAKTPLAVSGDPIFDNTATDGYFGDIRDRICRALLTCRNKSSFRILLYTCRPELFSNDLVFANGGVVEGVTVLSSDVQLAKENRKFDIAIVCQHIGLEHRIQFVLREKQMAPLVVVWAWDNHLDPYANLNFNALADVVIPSHKYCANALKSPQLLLGRTVPQCTSQWARSFARERIDRDKAQFRSNALHGGYVLWPIGNRTELLYKIKDAIPGNAIKLIDHKNREAYFGRSLEDRFAEWVLYKVSLAIPLTNDLSQRVFDALIAGQIPIVPESCYDLDQVVPVQTQKLLPIIRTKGLSPSEITEAWQQAIKLFDEMGTEGILNRHAFAREHHHISIRISQVTEYVKDIAANPQRIGIKIDDVNVGLVDAGDYN